MWEPSFEWGPFVVEQVPIAGQALDWKGFRRGSKSLVGVGHMGKCCEGFVGVSAK